MRVCIIHVIFVTVLGVALQTTYDNKGGKTLDGSKWDIDLPGRANEDINRTVVSQENHSTEASKSLNKSGPNNLHSIQGGPFSKNSIRKDNTSKLRGGLYATSRSDLEDRSQETKSRSHRQKYFEDNDFTKSDSPHIHARSKEGSADKQNVRFASTATEVEARVRRQPQDGATDESQITSAVNSASSSPFGTPRAQAGSAVELPLRTQSEHVPNSLWSSGELVEGHRPNEPSRLSRENSFEQITPTGEETPKPKTSKKTKLYRGAGIGVHYIRNNPKEAGLIGLSALGQVASVAALGPLVSGYKGAGLGVAGLGAISNFAAYAGQSGVNVKKWQKTEAKIPKEKQGEPLDPWIDAGKALASKSSQLTSAVGKTASRPLQVASGKLKQVMPKGMKKVQSDPNIWAGHNIRRSIELDNRHQWHTGSSRSISVGQVSSSTLRTRQLANKNLSRGGSAILLRRGTPLQTRPAKESQPKSPLSGAQIISATPPGQKSPPRKTQPQTTSSFQTTAEQKSQSIHLIAHELEAAKKLRSQPSKAIPSTKIPSSEPRSPSPPGLRHTKSSRNLLANLHIGHTSPPRLHSGQIDSPRPDNKLEGQMQRTHMPTDPTMSPTVSMKAKESKNPKSPPRAALNTDTRWPSPGRISPQARPKVDLSSLPKSPFDQPASPTRSSSPGKPSIGDFESPKSAFDYEGWSVPAWAMNMSPERPRSPTKEEALAELPRQKERAGGARPFKKFMRQPSIPSPKARPEPSPLKIQSMPSMPSSSSSSSKATSPFGSPEYQKNRPPFERPDPEAYKELSNSLVRGGSASKLPPAEEEPAEKPTAEKAPEVKPPVNPILANPIPKAPSLPSG